MKLALVAETVGLRVNVVAFTPKGGCPLKPQRVPTRDGYQTVVAFTPKGGCPLKPIKQNKTDRAPGIVAFTPKGGCPLKLMS